MAPPVVLDVSPEVYAEAARSVYRADEIMASAVNVHHGAARAWAAMAGSDAAGEQWGRAYDGNVVDLSRALATTFSATSVLARLVDQAGANHAAAESIAVVPGTPPPPGRAPAAVRQLEYPSAVGDLGPGLQGAVELADAVGVPCPNGDTDALRDASSAWIVLGQAMLDARSEVLGAAADLGAVDVPERESMVRDLRRLSEAVEAVAGACSGLAAACRDYAEQLEKTRRDIRDLIEQFAVEEAAAVAVGIGLAFVSAGLSAAAGAAITAGRFARTASRVRAVIAALHAFARMRRTETSMATVRRAADDVEDLATRVPVGLDDVAAAERAAGPPPGGWSSSRALDDHFARHGADVGARSADEYADLAARFRTEGSHQVKVGPDGTVRMYDPETNTFASYAPDGTTKTYFKPGSGASYWDRQPGVPE
ncbi:MULTISPECIES: hypothetical protein [Nocardiaceae]|uniref:Outer membrane channel protein CpnT-like N-terminal domain-containing protein n=1 Tax=Rhodococcoides corynebacterioides TaxID=53972 RepID=A0ABS2KVE8_9NOCA|nr:MULTISPECIES: hypothetical protein [Rhodococcus]MBM7415922.1 hypothetical protein [Rhodococcus corynebacterioides]MBP1118384.1 hypothetical protein [Rhodococcus sp. PvP016]